MPRPDWLFHRDDASQGQPRRLADGVSARVFAGERAMLSIVRLEPHSSNDIHSHPEEQWGVLLEGEATRIQDGIEVDVRVGDFWHTPSHAPHAMRTGPRGATVLDIFSPPRKEYRSAPAPAATDPNPPESMGVIDSAVLCDVSDQARLLPAAIRAVSGPGVLHGRAFTVSCPRGDNLWLHRAVYEASPGDVLVVSAGPPYDVAYWGELLTRAAMQRGLGGVILDGCARDGAALRRLNFPVFATGLCSRGPTKEAGFTGAMARPIRIGDCVIQPGDLVIADADGVAALPTDAADAALSAAARRLDAERDLLRRIADGERTLDLLGLDPS